VGIPFEGVQVPYLSASRLKLAKECALHYEFKYDPKNQDAITVKWLGDHRNNMQAAKLGTNIHNALEEWRRPNPKTGKVRKPLYGKLIELYDNECAKNEIDFPLYEDGKLMLSRWFQRRGMQKMKVISVEQAFGSHRSPYVLSNGTPVFGFIDLVFEHEDGTIELVDYKTQRAPITQGEADTNVQAGIYLTVARELWPDRPLRFTFDLTRYGTVTTIWADSRLDEFKTWLKIQYEWIQTLTKPPATIGPGCKWCPYTDLCPKAQQLTQNGSWELVVGEDPTTLDPDDMLDTLAAVKAAKSILDKKQRQITRTIKDEWFDPGAESPRIETPKWMVSLEDRQRTEFIPAEVQRIVGPTVFGQMAGVTKAGIERILPVLPDDVAAEVRRSAISKPFQSLNVRRRTDAK
tara:strand:- start:179 stop:1393 length:1215 start_codon:yes stop_codon:yes gene_type:complete